MTKRELKDLRCEIFDLEMHLDDDLDDDEYSDLVDEINALIAEYHDGRYEYWLSRGMVSSREEYNQKYGVFK